MKEYNGYVGGVVGTKMSKYGDFAGRMYFTVKGQVENPRDGSVREIRQSVPLHRLLDSVVEGATLHEALNRLFRSEQWQEWERDARFTLVPRRSFNPLLADDTKEELRKRLPAQVVQRVYDYYAALAEDQMEASSTEAAAEWRHQKAMRVQLGGSLEDMRQQVRDVRSYNNGVGVGP
jgi:hypothetical protein